MSRVFTLHSPLGDALLFRSLTGEEGLSQLFDFELTAQSKSNALPLNALLGKNLSISIETIGAQRFLNGIVTQASLTGSDQDSNYLYRLHIQPMLWLATRRSDSKIFQNLTVPQIITQVLAPYGLPLKLDLSGTYRSWEYCVQWQEDDFTFVSRLMELEGIYYSFHHDAQQHTLILRDEVATHPQLPDYDTIPYLSAVKIGRMPDEYIDTWKPTERIDTGQVELRDYDFKKPHWLPTAPYNVPQKHDFNTLQKYYFPGGFTEEGTDGRHYAQIALEAEQADHSLAQGSTNVRGIAPGHRFVLKGCPRQDQNREYLIRHCAYYFTENAYHTGESEVTHTSILTTQPVTLPFRAPRTTPLPYIRGPQTAVVTGPKGQENRPHCDEYGRVKVQFHWDRYGQKDENSSCWIRVSSPWASHNYGGIHLPRVGDEIIIEHEFGNPNAPIITGRVVNAKKMPVWQLPSQSALSGFRSQELGGGQSNHFLMDDTPGEQQVQVSSDHALSQLNLGYITRVPDTQGRKEFRGEGFELRTDLWGAVRAAQGLHLTTYKRPQAASHHKDPAEPKTLLVQMQELHQKLGELAAQRHAEDLTAAQALKTQNDAITGTDSAVGNADTPGFSNAQLLLSSPDGIAAATPQNIHLASGQNTAISTTQDLSLSIGRKLVASILDKVSLYAHHAGMKLIAGAGKLQVHAQSDDLELMADKQVRIQSTSDQVVISANKQIILTVGGNYLKITPNNVEIGGKKLDIYAPFNATGPKTLSVDMNQWPHGDVRFDDPYTLYNEITGKVLKNHPYEIIRGDGAVIKGVTDAQGRTEQQKSLFPENIQVRVLPKTPSNPGQTS